MNYSHDALQMMQLNQTIDYINGIFKAYCQTQLLNNALVQFTFPVLKQLQPE